MPLWMTLLVTAGSVGIGGYLKDWAGALIFGLVWGLIVSFIFQMADPQSSNDAGLWIAVLVMCVLFSLLGCWGQKRRDKTIRQGQTGKMAASVGLYASFEGLYATLPRFTRTWLGLCCAYFALRGALDVFLGSLGAVPLYHYSIGTLEIAVVLAYFFRPNIFPFVAGIVGLSKGILNLSSMIFVEELRWPDLVWLGLPFVVGLYCLRVVVIWRRSSHGAAL